MRISSLSYLTVFSLVYILGLIILYFSKSRIHNRENRIYKILLISNLVGLLLQFSCGIVSYTYDFFPKIISNFFFRCFSLYFIVWLNIIFYYLLEISFKNKKMITNLIVISLIIECIISILLPFEFFSNPSEGIYYTYGLSIDFTFLISLIICGIMVIIMLWKRKIVSMMKLSPIYLFLLFGLIAALIQKNHPELVIIAHMETFICCLMYFTIENPDVQMLDELYKNRKIIESSNQDMSNFLFKISQDIRKPVKDIIEITSDSEDITLSEINNIGKHLDYLIDDVLDLSGISTKKLKLYDNKYNVINLFKEVKTKANNRLDNKNIELEFKISKNIPEYVYGDGVRVKQILNGILDNAIDHTENGFITFEINTIIKYDICRFVIDITDNGYGIPIDKVNEILSLNQLDTEIDLDSNTKNLKVLKILVNKLGGNFMIKSDNDKGTCVSITLDQKIAETKETELSKKINMYEESMHRNKKIMVIDANAKELSKITRFLESQENNVSSSLFARDIIEKVAKKSKYDLIILDDEIGDFSALDVLNELKKDDKFSIPVVIMIDDKKEFIRLHYLKDGFADVILKSKLTSELERILKSEY